jgi:hypothetical protein
MGNNPVVGIDPDGELAWFVPIIIGAVLNTALHAKDIHNFWDALGYAAVGAASAAIGAGLASGVSLGLSTASLGGSFGSGFATGFGLSLQGGVGLAGSGLAGAASSFLSGAAIGGASGLGAGFSSGFGNGLVGGERFGVALGMGLRDGAIGGVTGGLIGGIAGGIDAVKDGRHLWSGKQQTLIKEYNLNGLPITKQPDGSNDCLLGCLESVEKLDGGNRTQADFQRILGKKGFYSPAQGSSTYDGINAAGFNVQTPTRGASPHSIGNLMLKGNPTIVAESSMAAQGTIKHAVIPTKVQIWQRGASKPFFRAWVMDPATGSIRTRHGKGFWTNNAFFRIIL